MPENWKNCGKHLKMWEPKLEGGGGASIAPWHTICHEFATDV